MGQFFIDSEGVDDPTLNLALEEFAVRHLSPEHTYLLFYINRPSVIVGKNQNTLEEIDHEYVEKEGVSVVRRISGGGAVYHDHGNLNFSWITRFQQGSLLNFRQFTDPVITVMRELGVPAELTGRNDIVADGRKISGNAQFTTAHSMFSHGTLLFDSQLDNVVQALQVKLGKIESKGLKSVRSRVANIVEFLQEPLTLAEFRRRLLLGIFGTDDPPRVELSAADREKVQELAETKYRTWEWNFGESPEFNIQRTHRFDFGEVDARIDVRKGRIEGLKIYGDFLGTRDVAEIEKKLRGVRYEPDDLRVTLGDVDLVPFFGGLTSDQFVDLLYS